MTLIRLVSDLHNEFSIANIPTIENEQDIILVLAGDIGLADKPHTIGPFVHEMAKRHKHVIMIMGNHEHYHTSFQRTFEKLRTSVGMWETHGQAGPIAAGIPSNVSIVEKETIILDGIAFICSTFWTNFKNRDPLVMMNAVNGMNDYNLIRNGVASDPYRRPLTPTDVYLDHVKARDYVFAEIKKQKESGLKVCVVTHHAPSLMSIHPSFRNPRDEAYNPCYASAYENEILDTNPDLWFHGHTHVSMDYEIGSTRIVANPRGYSKYPHKQENPDYDPCKLITL